MNESLPTSATDNLGSLFSALNRVENEVRQFDAMVQVEVIRNITIEGLDAFLKYHLYASSIRPEIAFGGYGTMVQEVLAEDGALQRKETDLIVSCLALDELDPAYGAPNWRPDAARNTLCTLFELLESKTRATIAVNTFIPPLYPALGIALAADGSDASFQVAELNRFIIDFVRKHPARFCLTDWNRYVALLGADAAFDHRTRYLWRAPFRKGFLNLYAADLARVVRALKGKAKKCLILDCDNTLWGGVVGEQGVDGIKLDRNDYPGKAFYDFQTSVLHLAERGVLIVLCTKNNEEDVFEVLDNHPCCLLKRSHLSGWRINWQDKATNIIELTEELNLGLDAFVFVDDNPAECELIRRMLPDVTVLQVPERLYDLPALAIKDGWFDRLQLTGEDAKRAKLYQAESRRKSARRAFSNIDEYLASLEIVAFVHRAHREEIARVAQLTQKTNQFNLTTRRYSERDLQDLVASEDAAVFALSAQDRFGDIGLVGVLSLRREGTTGRVDSFLMSCRALGRGLERAMLAHCLATMASDWDIDEWHAEYIPTRKNMQVADFWPKSGFSQSGAASTGTTYTRNARLGGGVIPAHIRVRGE